MVLKQGIYSTQWKYEPPGFTILGKDVSRWRKHRGFYIGEFRLKYQLIAYIQNMGYTTIHCLKSQ